MLGGVQQNWIENWKNLNYAFRLQVVSLNSPRKFCADKGEIQTVQDRLTYDYSYSYTKISLRKRNFRDE